MSPQKSSNHPTVRPALPGAWPALALLWFSYFLNQADRQVLPSVLPLIKAQFALDPAQLGLLNSAFHWVYAILVPFAGWIADKQSRRRVIIIALLVWSVATGLSGFAASFMGLILLRAITGAGEACYVPAATSLLTDLHSSKRTGLVLAIHQSSNYVGVACSGVLAGWIGETYGWNTAFFSFGIMGVIVASLLAWRLPDAPRYAGAGATKETDRLWLRLRSVFSVPSFYWLVGAFLGMLLVNTAYLAWTPTLLHERFSLSLPAAGLHAAVWHQMGALVGVLLGGKLSDWWLARSILGRPLTQVIGLLGGIPFIAMLGLCDNRFMVYAALGCFGVFRGIYDSALFTSLFAVMQERVRGLSTGLMISLSFFGGGFAPWIVGLLAKVQGLGPALAWSACGYGLGAVCLALMCATVYRRDAEKAISA